MGVITRPARLLFVTTDLRLGGGAEAMLARLVTAQPRLADEITVVSLLPDGLYAKRLRDAGIAVVELEFNRAGAVAAEFFRLVKLMRRMRPEIVQGWMYHGDLAALLALMLSGRRRRTRLGWSIRCSELDFRHYGLALRAVVKTCALLSGIPDIVTANSAAGLKGHLALRYHPRRSAVIANGIDVDAFKPNAAARAALRNELGLAEDAIVLAHVARVDPMKDHENLLSAMSQLPDVSALLIGSGTETLPPARNVIRLGRRVDVARLLPAADFIVSSSAFGEGFCNAVAEGMACGLPAVATDVGDARQIVGDTGVVIPPRDAVALAAAVRMLAAETAAARRARAQQARARIAGLFSLERAVNDWAALYASLTIRGGANS